MAALKGAKKVLRAEIKLKLKNMPWEEKIAQSEIITEKLLRNKKFQNSSRISIYLSRDIEVNTNTVLKTIFESGKTCFIPKYDSVKPVMKMVKLESMDDYKNLPLTPWNIKQPSESDNEREDALSTGGLDLMIVPGIAFTKEGHRMGNGKGYYDVYIRNYLVTLKKPVYTIALAFNEQIVPSVPVDEHDVRIDEVITPDS